MGLAPNHMKRMDTTTMPRPMTATILPLRVPFSAVDEAIHHLDQRSEPWSIHIEVRVGGSLDEPRLRAAIAVALSRHPMARARQLPWQAAQHGYEWEITERCDLDPLHVIVCKNDEALAAARSAMLSVQVPLVESPPLRVSLMHHPRGDVVMLNVNHAASDGLGAFRIMRSIARAYAGVPDPVPDLDPLSVRSLGDVVETWFSPPARMPLGLGIGALTVAGRLHLSFRYPHPQFGPQAAARFAARYVEALTCPTRV